MSDTPRGSAARPCSSCGRPRAECRTPTDLFLSCCHTCAANDGDTHRQPDTAAKRRVIRNHVWRGINGHPDDPECGICHEPVDDHADHGEWGS